MSELWSYLAPGDRETLMAGTIAWLLDPNGTHGLEGEFLSWALDENLGVATPAAASVKVK